MNILIICHRLPFPLTTEAWTFRVLNSVKYLSKKYNHNLTVAAFKYEDQSEDHLKEYCNEIVTINRPRSSKKSLIYYIANNVIGIFLGYIPLRNKNFLDYRFSWIMQRRVDELLKKEFDIIFVDTPYMPSYVSNTRLPKVLEVIDVPRVYYNQFKYTKNFIKRIHYLLLYFISKKYEESYEKFSMCITPTEQERGILNSKLQNLNISVIPFGVNMDFRIEDFKQDFPSLLFFGCLFDIFNQRSILYFYNEIYPLIKEKIPNVKLFIVGKKPSKEILKLSADKSVIVTGYVEDVRPYLARASVITLPFVEGYGIKTRILEAMAMGKPMVVSSGGIHGINVTPEENIIIADEPEEFARRVIELLNDKQLREKISANARKLMEEEYTWEKMTDKLNDVLQKVINRRG